MNRKLVAFLLIAVILIILVIVLVKPKITGNAGKSVEDNGSLQVFFCPKDNCSGHLIHELNAANVSINCAFFDMNLQQVSDALSDKAQSMPVLVVFDNENREHVAKLNPKFQYRFDTKSQLSHNKFCVIDNRFVFTGSMNPTTRDDTLNNNNILIIESAFFAENYQKEFEELWSGHHGKGKKVLHPKIILNGIEIDNAFCPEDRCERHVVEEISKAQHTVYFMTFSFTSEQIADAILANDNLVDIKGIFEKSQLSNYSQFRRLQGFGLNVRTDSNKYNLHHKVFIIDNETVITGSFNPTTNADERNDENLLIIHEREIAQEYLKEFAALFFS